MRGKPAWRETEERSSKLINDRSSLQAGFKTALETNLMKNHSWFLTQNLCGYFETAKIAEVRKEKVKIISNLPYLCINVALHRIFEFGK